MVSFWVACAQSEMRQGLSYFHSTIFNSLPIFYRRIDTALKQVLDLAKHTSAATNKQSSSVPQLPSVL